MVFMRKVETTPFKVRVSYHFKSFDDAAAARQRMKGFKYTVTPVIEKTERWVERQEERLDKVYENIPPGWVRLGELWQHGKRPNSWYRMSYKSFQRDMALLVLQGRVLSKPITQHKHGQRGNGTMVKRWPPREEA